MATDPALLGAVERLRWAAEVASRKARILGRTVLAWSRARIASVDPVTLFDRAGRLAGDRILWQSPAGRFGLVGVGTAWTATADGSERFKRVEAAWRSLLDGAVGDEPVTEQWGAGLVVMGGFAFAPGGPTGAEWNGYPAGTMLLPRVSVASVGDTSWITLAAAVAPEDRAPTDAEAEVATCLEACADAIRRGTTAPDGGVEPGVRLIEEFPPAEAWKKAVSDAAAAVREGLLTKVVLARAARGCTRRFDPARTLKRLRAAHPACTLFAVARGDRCFLGATPEQLVRLEDKQVSVSAVAGSAPRGITEEADRRLGEMLLASAKDRVEHGVVVDELRDALAEICTLVSANREPALLKAGNIQHLHTPLTAALRDRSTVLDLVERLHPTSAVGGVPRDGALRWIAEHEGLDRGWYAGPVGWMDQACNGEFAVAIRSALLHNAEALLFAGCGIVADSDPDQEYAESALKLRAVLSALNGA